MIAAGFFASINSVGGVGFAPALDLANFVDSSGNGRSLVLGGSSAPSFASNPFSIGQDGLVMSDTVNLAGYGGNWALNIGAYTLEFRFKRTSGHMGTTQVVMGRWGSSRSTQQFQWLAYFDTSNRLNFIHATNANGSGVTVQSAAISDTSAHAARVVYDGTSLYLYIDGSRVAGPTSAGSMASVATTVAFQVGNYSDRDTGSFLPLYATIGDVRLSNTARSTGSSYTVSSSPLTSDGNTLALLPLSAIAGAYLAAPSYQGAILTRTGHSQASGGWANPDGPLPMIGGGWFFSVSAYNGTQWTCWAVTASTLASLLSGGGTVGAAAIQTPTAGEGNLAANGTVIAWGGEYHHFYTDASSPTKVRHSTGTNLGAPFSPQPGTVIHSGYADPYVRPSPDGVHLVMYLQTASVTQRTVYMSTSTDGYTWSTPSSIIDNEANAGWPFLSGEFATPGEFQSGGMFGFGDGAAASTGVGRRVMRQITADGTNWLPGGLFFGPTGADSGSNTYLATFDASPFFYEADGYLYILAAHSTNTQPSQPTDSDIGLWKAALVR